MHKKYPQVSTPILPFSLHQTIVRGKWFKSETAKDPFVEREHNFLVAPLCHRIMTKLEIPFQKLH